MLRSEAVAGMSFFCRNTGRFIRSIEELRPKPQRLTIKIHPIAVGVFLDFGTWFFKSNHFVFSGLSSKRRRTRSSPMTTTSPLYGGAALTGKSGRTTANACDTNAKVVSNDIAAPCMFAKKGFTETRASSCNRSATFDRDALPPTGSCARGPSQLLASWVCRQPVAKHLGLLEVPCSGGWCSC